MRLHPLERPETRLNPAAGASRTLAWKLKLDPVMMKGPVETNEKASPEVDALLESVCSLAPAAPIVSELSHALADINTDARVIGEMISFDPILTAKLLRICNSAFLAPGSRITTVSQAVTRLGFPATRRVVMMVLLVERLKALPRGDGFDSRTQWCHSVTTAFAAQFLAEQLGMDVGTLFTAGLMHDLGKLVLAAAFRGRYAVLVNMPQGKGCPLTAMENERLGISHPEAGARLLERWASPAAMVSSVRYHHDPAAAAVDAPMAACLQMADALAYAYMDGVEACSVPESDWPPALHTLGLAKGDLQGYLDKIAENFQVVEALFGLHPG